MTEIFVPEDFEIPESLVTDQYCLQILEPGVAGLDYDAVMSSKQRLRQVFRKDDKWPADDMSLEFNINDLKQHEAEFHARKAFAYTVLSPRKDRCVGCVYIYPCSLPEYDCEVFLWVRSSEADLDNELYTTVHKWLKAYWPFKNVVFPGREIPWENWKGKFIFEN
ncbi:MAG: hypothetical protein K9L30_05820 [Desulfobacterales bacterium]|nr:hypothetical protein [Desulfobacterales bacterium]